MKRSCMTRQPGRAGCDDSIEIIDGFPSPHTPQPQPLRRTLVAHKRCPDPTPPFCRRVFSAFGFPDVASAHITDVYTSSCSYEKAPIVSLNSFVNVISSLWIMTLVRDT